MSDRKRLIFILLITVLHLSCARYNTLVYLMVGEDAKHAHDPRAAREVYGKICGHYTLHPAISCFKNSIRGDLNSHQQFSVRLWVHTTGGKNPTRDSDLTLFAVDSLAAIFYPGERLTYLRRTRSSPFDKNGVVAVVHGFGLLNVPPDVDSISVVVKGYTNPVHSDSVSCDSLAFQMYRYEKSSWSLWVG